jgi:hypothetical protein
VSVPTGSSLLGSIGPAVDATARTVDVKGRAPLELELLLYDAGSPGSRLFGESGERCFTMAGLEAHVREALAAAGVPIRFKRGSMPLGSGVERPRGTRYAEGCAIFIDAAPVFPDGRTEIRAELWQRPAG